MRRFFLFLSIIEIFFVYLIQYIYHFVMDINFLFPLLLVIFYFNYKMTKTKRILNIFIQGGIFALIPIIILVYKPSYTYKQAINIISSKIDIPYEIEKTDVNILLENTSNPLVKKIYYISFLTQSESRVSFTFDPCTGIYNQVEDN